MIVLDSSAAVDYLARLSTGAWVEERLKQDPDVHAPHTIDVEVVSALRRLHKTGVVSNVRARFALAALLDLDLARYSHLPLLSRMWQLRSTLSAGDAAFVALAELLGASLVTTDRRLARSHAPRIEVLCP